MLHLTPFCPWGIIGNPLIYAANVGQTLEGAELVQVIFFFFLFKCEVYVLALYIQYC